MRERCGLTQEQLAEMVGITASRESEYESGRFATSEATRAWCEA